MGTITPNPYTQQEAGDSPEEQMQEIQMTVKDLHRCVGDQLNSAKDRSDEPLSPFHTDLLDTYIDFLTYLQGRFDQQYPDRMIPGFPPRELMNYQRDQSLPDFSVFFWLRSIRHGQEYEVPPYAVNRILRNSGAVLDIEFESSDSPLDEKRKWEELVKRFLTREFNATSQALDELTVLHHLSGGYKTLEHIFHQLHEIGAGNPHTSALYKEIVARAIIYEMFETYLNNWHIAQRRSELLAHLINFTRDTLHILPATLVATAQTGHPWFLPIIVYLMFENFGTRRKESREG